MKKNTFIFIVILLLVVASFIRLYKLDAFATFLGDQGRDAIIVRNIVTLKHFPAIGAPSSIGMIYLGPFYYYLIAPFLLLSNFNPVGLAFGVALISIAGIIFSYALVQKELNQPTAFLFLILISFTSILVELSRFSWNPNLLPLFSFFTLYFFYKFITTKKTIFALAFGAFLSFSIQLHYLAMFLTVPIAIIFFQTLQQEKIKQILFQKIGYAITAFTFFSSPLIIFDLKHDFLNSKDVIKLFSQQGVIAHSSLLNRFIETTHAFFQILLKLPIPSFFTFILLCVCGGYYFFIHKKEQIPLFIKLHALNALSFIIFFSFLNSIRNPHYYGAIYMSFFLVMAYLLSFAFKHNMKYLSIIGLVVYLILNIRTYDFLNGNGNYQIDRARRIAASFAGKITNQPVQLVPDPFTETDGHFRYFLELNGYQLLPFESAEQPKALFVLCFTKDCQVLGNAQWQIAAFSITPPQITATWQSEGVTIYKLEHKSSP